MNYMGILTLGENERDIRALTINRPLASIPIGGRYRVIDFILSNIVNSGITNVGVFSFSDSRSLVDHLSNGTPWDLNRKIRGLFLFNYSLESTGAFDIKILRNNLEYLYRSKEENVVIAPSYMLCNMNLKEVISYYESSNADIVTVYNKNNNAKNSMHNCYVLNIDEDNKVISVGRNIGANDSEDISMEMFILKKSLLIEIIYDCMQNGYYESICDSILKRVNQFNIKAYEFQGYVKCINSVTEYFKANMDMLDLNIIKELFYKNGPIYTKATDEPPTKYFNDCVVKNSIISKGCIIKGNISNSLLARKVIINKDAHIENCIIFQGCEIKEKCYLKNVIIDKNRIIERGTELVGSAEFPLVIEKKNRLGF